jgi:uncharacterized membrane protein
MSDVWRYLRQAHYFLASRWLYPLLMCSALAIGILATRIYLSASGMYVFLGWNLILAWLPYACSIWAAWVYRRYGRRGWPLILPGAAWLIFFPNAPYLITDFLHLREHAPIPLWYDIGLLTAFAWTGCFLAVASLRIMQSLVAECAGRRLGVVFALGSLGMAGLGVYLGRFLRWNSWDVLLQPGDVLADLARRLANPAQSVGVTLMFAALLFMCYLTIVSLQQREQ